MPLVPIRASPRPDPSPPPPRPPNDFRPIPPSPCASPILGPLRCPIASRVPFSSATPKTSLFPLPPPSALSRPISAISAGSSILRWARASRRGAVLPPASPSCPWWRATALPGSRLAWFCTFFASSTGALSGFGGEARTTSGRGLINSGSPALTFGGGTAALQNFIPVTIRIAAMLATRTPFQSVCSPPTRAAPRTRRMRSARLPLDSTATDLCGSGTMSPCASAWLRPRTRSSGPPSTFPSSSRRSSSGSWRGLRGRRLERHRCEVVVQALICRGLDLCQELLANYLQRRRGLVGTLDERFLLTVDELQSRPRLLRAERLQRARLQLHHDAQLADRDQVAVAQGRGNDWLAVQVQRRGGGGAKDGTHRSGLDDRVRRRDARRLQHQVGGFAPQADPLRAESSRALELSAVVHFEDDRAHRVSAKVINSPAGARPARGPRTSGEREACSAARPSSAPGPARRRVW